jgi:nicotinate-nucleotide adenylyltransferase
MRAPGFARSGDTLIFVPATGGMEKMVVREKRPESLRLGVLGGTFNPVHMGHLHIARSVRRLFSLSEVLFVVAARPPHKPLDALIPLMHRYAMVSLATAGEPSFVPSLIELEPQASSFSFDTMSKLARQVARANGVLYFIAGGDSLLEVKSWRRSERLLTAFNFVFVVRPGTGPVDPKEALPSKAALRVCDLTGLERAEMKRRIAKEDAAENRIYIVNVGAPDISATQIRERAGMGKPIHRMVSRPVREYIEKLHLYGGR